MRKKLPLISGILNVLEKLKGNTGIIENTDVAVHTIAAGKYVIWKNDLYKASSAISIGDTLSLSNLTAVSDGIANELNSNIGNHGRTTLVHTFTNDETYNLPDDFFSKYRYVYMEVATSNNIANVGGSLLVPIGSISDGKKFYIYNNDANTYSPSHTIIYTFNTNSNTVNYYEVSEDMIGRLYGVE